MNEEMFTCQKYRCTMRKVVCVQRHRLANEYEPVPAGGDRVARFGGCKYCDQGKTIREGIGMEEPAKSGVKTCKKCGKEKPLNEFTANKNCKDNRENACKECRAEYARAMWRKTHPGSTPRTVKPLPLMAKDPEPANPVPPASRFVFDPLEVKDLVDAHWKYVGSLLRAHNLVGTELIEYHYKTAFLHGFKHGVESIMEGGPV
jgi:hypothetical protein